MSLTKKIILGIIALVVVIQFFRIDKSNPPIDPAIDMINVVDTPPEVELILNTSCYDCHSNKVVYPWYSNVAPISWWVKKHINEGREEFNFSEYGTYSDRRKDHKLEEIVEMVEEGEMPLESYLIIHGDAKLDDVKKSQLKDWAKSTKTSLGYVKEEKE